MCVHIYKSFDCNYDFTYPSILIFVSNNETITSVSKLTSLATSLTAFSNSSKSPNT